ncbi:MAG: hypothetical protein ACREQY_16975 [Candidatus Binatia bacterium]
MFDEEMQLIHLRVPKSLAAELEEAQHALGKASLADLAREALRRYLDENEATIKAYRRLRERHG